MTLFKKLGCTAKERIINCDSLFFPQLLHPRIDPAKSGFFKNDPQIPHCANVEKWLGSVEHWNGAILWPCLSSCNCSRVGQADVCLDKSGALGKMEGEILCCFNCQLQPSHHALIRRWMMHCCIQGSSK